MTTLENIQSRIKKLQAQAEALISKRASAVLDDIRALMERHGLTTADLDAHVGTGKRRGRPAGKQAAKPALKQGAARKIKGTAKPKGKLPAKYLNPKTGETWSGWARPPAWIKNVKDRSRFLISGAVADSPVKLATKKAAKKAVAKKAVAAKPAKKASPAKKATSVKPAAKKVTAKKAVSGKAATGKAIAGKAPGKKLALKSTATRKTGLRKPGAHAAKPAVHPAANGKTTMPAGSTGVATSHVV